MSNKHDEAITLPKKDPEKEKKAAELLKEVFKLVGYIKAKELLTEVYIENHRAKTLAKRHL